MGCHQSRLAHCLIALALLSLSFHSRCQDRPWSRTDREAHFEWPQPSLAVHDLHERARASWLIYAMAFWLFARSLLGEATPGSSWRVRFCELCGGHYRGLRAGGIAVREAALVAMLAPVVDSRVALMLALGSRLWMIALEI